jgi:CheY-like chemotaxis protein
VLIVEDEAIIAADLGMMLRRLGYVLAGIVASGEDAVRQALELRPEVILMDVQLEGLMNGIEAAQAIRAEHNAAIVYVTALSRIASAELGPGYRCIGKPFTRGDLRTSIEDALAELAATAASKPAAAGLSGGGLKPAAG